MAQAACVDFASTVRCEMDSLEFQRVMPAFVADIVRCLKERLGLEQPIDGVATTVWDFTIGGYQVAQPQRWLNYRKGRTLSFDDVSYYQRMLGALAETIRIQAEIDAVVPGWPLA